MAAGGFSYGDARSLGRTLSREEGMWLEAFERRAGSEDDAQNAWGGAVDTARRVPALGALLGADLASVTLEVLGVPTFLVHVYGGEVGLRARVLHAAVAAGGDPSRLVASWRQAPMPVVQRLRLAGILPVAFEQGIGGPPDAVLRSALVGGVVATREGHPHQPTPWTLAVLSSGSEALSPPTTVAESVFQLRAPGAGEISTVLERAGEHHGWPYYWLARSELLAGVVADHERALGMLGAAPRPRVGALAAMGVCVNALGRLVGRERPLEADVGFLGEALSTGGGDPVGFDRTEGAAGLDSR